MKIKQKRKLKIQYDEEKKIEKFETIDELVNYIENDTDKQHKKKKQILIFLKSMILPFLIILIMKNSLLLMVKIKII